MSKAILVMGMPECCYECRYCNGKEGNNPHCALTNYAGGFQTMLVDGIRQGRSIWCPLLELPEEMQTAHTQDYNDGWNEGWNACLDAIEGSGEHE